MSDGRNDNKVNADAVATIVEFLKNPENRERIQSSLSQAHEAIATLNKARAVHTQSLHEPVTL